jgi:hypothetical protein
MNPPTTTALRIPVLMGIFCGFVFMLGCVEPESHPNGDYLVRVGDSVLTGRDFSRTLELAKAAYPEQVLETPADLAALRSRVLRELTDHLIIEQRAKELGIAVSDAELASAVDAIRADYPEGAFDTAFLENSVSYRWWSERLKDRLLTEKVIHRDLVEQIALTPKDIAAFLDKQPETEPPSPAEQAGEEEKLLRDLRRNKAEEALDSWMATLRKSYTIEFNKKEWERINGDE